MVAAPSLEEIWRRSAAQISEIHATIVKGAPANSVLINAAREVVRARHDSSDKGWDLLKEAVGRLEDLVGRPR